MGTPGHQARLDQARRRARWTRGRRAIVLALPPALLLSIVLAFAAPLARAHGEPASTVTVEAGPYRLLVGLSASPPRTSQPLQVLVTPLDLPPEQIAALRVELSARPGLGTDATPVRGRVTTDPDQVAAFAGEVLLPVQGAWVLEIAVDGALGQGVARVPVTAAAPGAIPLWLGWAIGLAPLLGVAYLALWLRREVRRLLGGPAHDRPGLAV